MTVDVEPPPLTHEQFITTLDRMCRRANQARVPYGERYEAATTRGDYDAAADILEDVQELNAPVYARIAALDVPPEDEGGLERYIDLTRQLEAFYVRTARALREEDMEKRSRLDTLIERVRNRRTLGTAELGLTECGS